MTPTDRQRPQATSDAPSDGDPRSASPQASSPAKPRRAETPWPPPTDSAAPSRDGQTGTPHQGRSAGGGGDRRRDRRRRGVDLVDQRRAGDDQPSRRRRPLPLPTAAQARARIIARAVARRSPKTAQPVVVGGQPSSPVTAALSTAAIRARAPSCWSYSRDTRIVWRLLRCTATRSRCTATTAAAARSARSTARPADAGPPAPRYSQPRGGAVSRMARRCCRPAIPGSELWRSDMVRMLSLRRDRRPDQAVVERPARRCAGWHRPRPARRRCRCSRPCPAGRPAADVAAAGQGRRRAGISTMSPNRASLPTPAPRSWPCRTPGPRSTCRRLSPSSTWSTRPAPGSRAPCCPSRHRRPTA